MDLHTKQTKRDIMLDYSKSKIYKLQCEDGHFYIGSTANELRKRFQDHKSHSKTRNSRVYTHINELGWDKVRIVLIEDFCCENREQLVRKEDEHIRTHKDNQLCLNTYVAVMIEEDIAAYHKAYNEAHKEDKKAYYEAHKEDLSAYQKKYRETHKEELSAYYEAHKEVIAAKEKAYYEANKEDILAKSKTYYEANKEELSAKAKARREAHKKQNESK
jgi:hypothetical protein